MILLFRRTFRSLRWFAAWLQAVLVIAVPFVKIRGESALRFDVPSLKLYFFGSVVWISEAYFFLLVFLIFLIGVMLFTVLFGRIWCGWMCPQTILSDAAILIEKASSWFVNHKGLRFALSQALFALFSAFVSASLIWYFVSPYDMIDGLMSLSLGPWTSGIWLFFGVLIYLNLAFVRRKFCAAVCPYARFQSALFDEGTLTIAFDEARAKECGGCEACVHTCPAGIDIREGLQVECINCAECIDACSAMMARRGKSPLVRYLRGAAKSPGTRVIGLSLVLAVLAVLLAYQLHERMPFSFWVLREEAQPIAGLDRAGDALNAYSLIVENRSLDRGVYELSVSGIRNADLHLSRNPFSVSPNSSAKMKVYVVVQRQHLKSRITTLRFVMRESGSREIRLEQEASFIYTGNPMTGE